MLDKNSIKNLLSFKKYDTSSLCFAKCRHCIMDIINSYSMDGNIIEPRPDYIDYYTILKRKYDTFNENSTFIRYTKCENLEENYNNDIVFYTIPLDEYIKEHDKLSYKECLTALTFIKKIKGVKDEYGYVDFVKKLM